VGTAVVVLTPLVIELMDIGMPHKKMLPKMADAKHFALRNTHVFTEIRHAIMLAAKILFRRATAVVN
jgi:hypothetical protein